MLLRRRPAVSGVCAVVLAMAAGCGGGGGDSQSTGGDGTPPPASGKEIFSTTCGGCHTLADAGTTGQVGPNLDEIAPSKDIVLATLRAGPGAMPENLVVGKEADRVATYVSSVAGK
jgi:mono/diheme cytochrome c family protein